MYSLVWFSSSSAYSSRRLLRPRKCFTNSIISSRSRYEDSSRSGFQSSVHERYQSNAQAYDKSLLQKLDARRGSDNTTPPRGYSKSVFSSSAKDASPTSRIATLEHRHPSQLKPLSLPIITSRGGLVESPLSRWTYTPLSSGTSPRNPYSRFGMHGQFDHRSPSDTVESNKSHLPYIRRSGSSSFMSAGDDASSITSRSRESYDQGISPEHDVDFHMEEAGLRRLHLDDYSSRLDGYSPGMSAGQKRRASSPPVDDGPSLHTVGSASDLFRWRESASRISPVPRFHSTSASVSSTQLTSERLVGQFGACSREATRCGESNSSLARTITIHLRLLFRVNGKYSLILGSEH